MKLTKEQLKQIIKEELESVMSQGERTGTLEIGNDNNFGPVLVFSFNEGRGEGKVIEVLSSKLGLSQKHVDGLAAKAGSKLGDVDPRLAGLFAKKFEAPYNDADLLSGLEIALQSSYNAQPAEPNLRW